jgi:hypothetical protein
VVTGIERIGPGRVLGRRVAPGVILPKSRGDLLESVTVVDRMLAGEIQTIGARRPTHSTWSPSRWWRWRR